MDINLRISGAVEGAEIIKDFIQERSSDRVLVVCDHDQVLFVATDPQVMEEVQALDIAKGNKYGTFCQQKVAILTPDLWKTFKELE